MPTSRSLWRSEPGQSERGFVSRKSELSTGTARELSTDLSQNILHSLNFMGSPGAAEGYNLVTSRGKIALRKANSGGQVIDFIGAPCRDRTYDLLIKSYFPNPRFYSPLFSNACYCLKTSRSRDGPFTRCSPLFSRVWCTITAHF